MLIPDIIRHYDNENQPIVTSANETLELTYFNLLQLERGEHAEICLEQFESVYVPLFGSCDITVDGVAFKSVGKRKTIWSGRADSVYAPTGSRVVVKALKDTEVALAGGACKTVYKPFRIPPEEVDIVEVGSRETGSRRRIFHILGQNAEGRAGNLLVSELYADPGCWSGLSAPQARRGARR